MMKFDEMYTSLPYEFFSGGEKIRDHYKIYDEWLARQPGDMMATRREEAEVIFRRVGITFAVYGDKDDTGAGHERLIAVNLALGHADKSIAVGLDHAGWLTIETLGHAALLVLDGHSVVVSTLKDEVQHGGPVAGFLRQEPTGDGVEDLFDPIASARTTATQRR